ncbi:MAG: transglycosylase SLT domain-containing protein [Alphaproteobacteria bacterium]
MSIAPLNAADPKLSVTDAISLASRATGVDFSYLLNTAKRESSLNPEAKSGSSSATGLFQFLDQTWFATVKRHGAEHGLGTQAGFITQTGGRFEVEDPAQKQAILSLRKDPRIAALMAGEFTNDSKSALETQLGRKADSGELYLAHFFGPREAARFISEGTQSPGASAAASFPDAAHANRGVFYGTDGSARSFGQVKDYLTHQHGGSPASLETARAATPSAGFEIPNLRLPSFSESSDEETPRAFLASAPMPALRLTPEILTILASLDPVQGGADGSSSLTADERERT